MKRTENRHPTNHGDRNRFQALWEKLSSRILKRAKKDYLLLLTKYYKHYVNEQSSILEIGFGEEKLLSKLSPSTGVFWDVSSTDESQIFAQETAFLRRVPADDRANSNPGQLKFDYIVFPDSLSHLIDILKVLKLIKPHCHSRTRIIANIYSQLWQPLLYLLELIGLKRKQQVTNWVTREDVSNFMTLAGFESILTDKRILMPLDIPVFSTILNKFLAAFPPFNWFCLTNWIVGRLPRRLDAATGVSVICPCRNEAGNIISVCQRMPDFGCDSELIFVEGHSSDNTFQACSEAIDSFPGMDISLLRQTGKGKGDAVRTGFEKAKYPVLAILDADMTVKPEELPTFVDLLKSGICEFVNGSRLVYAMEDDAMRYLNLLGNKFFSLAFTFLLDRPIKDTLCGTKVLLKSDYERLASQRNFFGDFDPFGDFDLLFGAAKLGLKIMDFPIRYQARTYGSTQIDRFAHGLLLFRMCSVALVKLKLR